MARFTVNKLMLLRLLVALLILQRSFAGMHTLAKSSGNFDKPLTAPSLHTATFTWS
jgi:hypothetical protein